MSALGPMVFIVEQDEAVRALLENLIESAKLKAVSFGSPKAFLEHLEPGALGCVLLDIDLPDRSGLALAQRLAAEQPHLSIILIAGRGDLIATARANPGAMLGIFAKPFDVSALLNCVRRGLARQGFMCPG